MAHVDIDLGAITLASGAHKDIAAGMCAMELVSFLAGEPFSDHPSCTCPVIAAFVRAWNDEMNDADRQMLKPIIPRLIGTRASKATERQRSYLALDWYCRVSAPAWLRLAGLTAEAAAIEATAPIVDATSTKAAQGALDRARKAADAAGAAAGDAAWAAAWATAWAAAGATLRPTVEQLQASALSLLDRMIAVTDEVAA